MRKNVNKIHKKLFQGSEISCVPPDPPAGQPLPGPHRNNHPGSGGDNHDDGDGDGDDDDRDIFILLDRAIMFDIICSDYFDVNDYKRPLGFCALGPTEAFGLGRCSSSKNHQYHQ